MRYITNNLEADLEILAMQILSNEHRLLLSIRGMTSSVIKTNRSAHHVVFKVRLFKAFAKKLRS